jgi:hypothetical protein
MTKKERIKKGLYTEKEIIDALEKARGKVNFYFAKEAFELRDIPILKCLKLATIKG